LSTSLYFFAHGDPITALRDVTAHQQKKRTIKSPDGQRYASAVDSDRVSRWASSVDSVPAAVEGKRAGKRDGLWVVLFSGATAHS
jgi:hypothetical protein